MYYEEKVIKNVLCHRGTPDGDWIPFTSTQLTEKLNNLRFHVFDFVRDVENYIENQDFTDDPLGLFQSDIDNVKRAL